MLTERAQPTSPISLPMRALLSAASPARFTAVALLFALLCALMPSNAGAQSSTRAAAAGGAWPWPVLGEVITPFKNVPDRYAAGQHRGLDIAAPAGASVLAIVDGRVSYSGRLPDGGQTITVTSRDGRWLVSNLHLSARLAQRGDAVRAGQRLGSVGTSGRRSAGAPHLHLSVREAATRRYVDPMTLLGSPRLAAEPARSQPRVTAAKPKITSLERPARSANVRAPQIGGVSPAKRHGAENRQSTHTRSAGARAREGHAARGTSRVAPPPLKSATSPAAAAQASSAARESSAAQASRSAPAEPAATTVATPTAGAHGALVSRRRPLLLAIAVVCVAALLMRSQPKRESSPAAPEPQEGTAAGEVTDIDNWRKRA